MPSKSPFVVITSIFSPTNSVRGFATRLPGRTIVVGDRKTPPDWSLPGAEYLAPASHHASGGHLADKLPWNHYSRKMLGYLEAARQGASIIFDTDDDNQPVDDWAIPDFDDTFASTPPDLGFVNLYQLFSDTAAWPRGFPLRAIRDPRSCLREEQLTAGPARVGVWQMLVHGEPDVDAIYRLVDQRPVEFRHRPPVVLRPGTLCPFNSQATAFIRPVFPLLFLPGTVTSRFTDILRSLVAQPIMWAAGFSLGFTRPMVSQERNPHDLMADFAEELPVYLHSEKIPAIIAGVIRRDASIPGNLTAAYAALHREGIVGDTEPALLASWLEELSSLRKTPGDRS